MEHKTVLKVGNITSRLVSTDNDLTDLLYEKLRFRPKDFWHNEAYKKRKWDGWKNFFSNNGTFMTGLLPEVQAALRIKKVAHTFIDQRNDVKWIRDKVDDKFLNDCIPDGFNMESMHDYQPDLANQAFKYNRGIIQAPTGCHRKGQGILQFNGKITKVEDVKVGDLLMGPDSRSRRVQQICRGKEKMYQIAPTKGESFVVNESHILTLVKTTSHANRSPCEKGGELIDVKVKDWIKWSNWKKHIHKLVRCEVEFESRQKPEIDPYFLGVLLGDEKCPQYAMSDTKGKPNSLSDKLRTLKLWGKICGDKFIPHLYKTSTKSERLSVLAGLIDTGGYLCHNGYDLNLKSQTLANDIAFVARSLGLAAYVSECTKASQNGTKGTYHRVSISGDTNRIPCRISYKQTSPRKQKKNVLRTGFKAIPLDTENYYGFTLDKDGRYLLDDFTVTHNSGKTLILISILKSLPPKTPVLFLTKNSQLVHQNWEEMKAWGVPDLGRWYDGHHEPNWVMCATSHVKTFASIEKLLPKFKVLLVDEVHECMSKVPISTYKKMKMACVRLGFSATPFKWNKKKIDNVHKWVVKGNFGPVFRTSTTKSGILQTKDLQKRGILSRSDCTFYPIESPNLAYEPYQDAVKMGIEQNLHFHDVVKRLARSRKGRTLIVVERLEQGEYLNNLMPEAHWIQGKDSLKKRAPVINALREDESCIAIIMKPIITAGINIKIHNLINAAGGDAAQGTIQLMGRGLRLAKDKDQLQYYDFHFLINDYLRKHSEWRMQVLRDEEGHNVILKEALDF